MIHSYQTQVVWTGNTGSGTIDYKAYERSHTISIKNKTVIMCSSDAAFRGDQTKHNPEDLFLSSIASCHMLWYLHLCAEAGIVVLSYEDTAVGMMEEFSNGSGHFTEVILRPQIVITNTNMIDKANALHHEANNMCFIANSCNFSIRHEPVCKVAISK